MYRTARECCCVSDSTKVLNVSNIGGAQSGSDNEGVLRVSVSEGVLIGLLGVRHRRNKECCCVLASDGVLSVSNREGALSVLDGERVLSVSDGDSE